MEKEPLLLENPNKNFEVFINDQKLIDGQIVIQGFIFIRDQRNLSCKELRRSNIKIGGFGTKP